MDKEVTSYGGVGKKLNILVYDFGLAFTHALRMAEDGHEVKYFTPWASSYPSFADFAPGLGYEKQGVEKVMFFYPHVDWADLIVFFDVGTGDLADTLRNQGKCVFGSSLVGDSLENKRELMRKIQQEIGLPVQQTAIIKGVPNLRTYLKKNKDKYVKLNVFRKDVDSFLAHNYDEVEQYLDQIEVSLGPFNEVYEFLVEDRIEGCEPGFDMFFNGHDWVKPYLWGIEQSKESYLGIYTNTLPAPLAEIADKLKIVLQKINYRGAMSIECRITKDKKPYLIDICSRYPFPLSALYTLSIKNYTEVIYNIAQGKPVEIQNAGKFVAAMPLYSEAAEHQYVELNIPDNLKKYVRTRTSAIVNDKVYAVKGAKVIAVDCAVGDDYNKLFYFLEKLPDKVQAFKISDEATNSLIKIKDKLPDLPKYGLTGF